MIKLRNDIKGIFAKFVYPQAPFLTEGFMKKNRLEAFSDGVFAIVITLLVLSIKLSDVPYSGLYNGLIMLLPNIAVYVLSFLLVGMYRVFHHYAFLLMKEADGVLLWLNIIFLVINVLILQLPRSSFHRFRTRFTHLTTTV